MHRFRENFPDLPTWLAALRLRPGMYIGGKSLFALEHELYGISIAEEFHGIPEGERFGGFDLPAFEKWVDETLNTERLVVRSMYLARERAGSDSAGFDLWFEWYDRFRSRTAGQLAAG